MKISRYIVFLSRSGEIENNWKLVEPRTGYKCIYIEYLGHYINAELVGDCGE